MAKKLYAMWTHGNVAVSEGGTTQALRQEFRVTFTIPAGQRDWIHIPIPTPVFIGDRRVSLAKVFYLYNAANGAVLKNVHIYDGPTGRVLGGGHLDLGGDYSTALLPDILR
jgi:hypothetical protein